MILGDFQEVLGNGFGLEKFKKVLFEIDLVLVVLFCEVVDNVFRFDLVFLLEDVFLVVRYYEENFLDCY